MNKRHVFTEAILMIVVLQALLILFKYAASSYLPDSDFAKRMTMMTAMIILSAAVVIYAKLRKTELSVFPERFSKFYIIATAIAAFILIATPSNYTGGYEPILLLIYGSIVTPVFEELVFRGYLWNRLGSALAKEVYTYIWSVVLFTVWHLGYMLPQLAAGNWFAVITKLAAGLCYGLVLGFARLKCKNCYITMLLHAVLNSVMI